MIVTCQRCATQFQLDDAKVSGSGIRVRCSRCKHAFFVEPPGAGERERRDSRVERAVRSALEDAPPALPDVTRDLPSEDEAPQAPDLRADEIPGESEWEFNDEPAFAASADEVADEDADEDTRPLVDPEPAAALEAFASEAEEPEADSDALALDDLDAFLEEPLPALAPAPAVRAERPAQRPPVLQEPAVSALGAGRSRLQAGLRRASHASGWALVAGLTLAALHGSLTHPAVDPVAGGQSLEGAGIAAESLRGRWIENARGGPLYVVSGTARPSSAGAASGGGRQVLRAVDAEGAALAGATAPLGPPLPDRALREVDPGVLVALHARHTHWLRGPELGSGAPRPFQAIFPALPARAAYVRLEASREALAPGIPDRPAAAEPSPARPEPGAEGA